MSRNTIFYFLIFLLFYSTSYGQNIATRNATSIGIGNIGIIEAAPNGDRWVGSTTQGVALVPTTGPVQYYNKSVPKTNLRSDAIVGFEFFPNGATVIATSSGMSIVDPVGVWDTIPAVAGQPIDGMASRGDTLWVIANNTVRRFQFKASDTSFTTAASKTISVSSPISVMTESPGACTGFWLGTTGAGCFRIPKDTITLSIQSSGPKNLVNNAVNDIDVTDACDKLYVATQGGFSICPTDPSTACQNFTTSNGLSQNFITEIAAGCDGNIWLGTKDSGVLEYNINTGTFQRFTKKDGLTDNRITGLDESDDCSITVTMGDDNAIIIDSALKVVKVINNISNIVRDHIFVTTYPNPANQMIHFDFDKTYAQGELMLTDMTGKTVYQSNINHCKDTSIDVTNFVPGNYIYTIRLDAEKIKTGRVVIF